MQHNVKPEAMDPLPTSGRFDVVVVVISVLSIILPELPGGDILKVPLTPTPLTKLLTSCNPTPYTLHPSNES